MSERLSLDERKARVKARVSLVSAVEKHVKLSGSAETRNRRGKCPFHNGQSASFSLKAGQDFGHCFGCGWNGDVIRFTQDMLGLSFMDALQALEAEIGETAAPIAQGRGPIQRERSPTAGRRVERQLVEPIDMGRWIWKHASFHGPAIRTYFAGRGVPERVLHDARLAQFRYLADCPCIAWEVGQEPHPGRVRGMLLAPAVIAMVRVPRWVEDPDGASGRLEFTPVGVHVTYLDPSGTATMKRRKPWAKADDADPWLPKRRMLGAVGRGAVILGEYRADAHLWVGEGNETVLSGMALGGAAEGDVGIATLSLDNLQGDPRLWQGRHGRIWPLFDMRPDPEKRPAFTIPGHRGRVTGLVDSDMSPLRGFRDQRTGELQGEAVVERKGGPIVRREISGPERAQICADLFVKAWRAGGVHQVRAVRAPLGMDFNDVARGEAA
jgi:DNA primase